MHLDGETLARIRDALQLVRLAIVIGFVVAGIRVIRASAAIRRRRINQLIAYLLALHIVIALAQTDVWPFSNYPMMTVDVSDPARVQQLPVFRAVDQRGAEWQVDPCSWSPLYPQNLTAWLDVVGPKITSAQRGVAMRYLLHRAEEARRRRIESDRYFGNAALLGPFTAPDIDLLPDVAPSPLAFHRLRLYRQTWRPAQFARDRSSVTYQLIDEVTE
ncbi:MAG: hypothetical protein QOI24_1313 [Acidobacteriota bacterium]|jgi:hypothetical protein|nr:hypothetical protein [Acidobacteriota bacterium]